MLSFLVWWKQKLIHVPNYEERSKSEGEKEKRGERHAIRSRLDGDEKREMIGR